MAADEAARLHGKRVRIQALVDPAIAERLRALAEKEGRSLSNFASEVLAAKCNGRRPK